MLVFANEKIDVHINFLLPFGSFQILTGNFNNLLITVPYLSTPFWEFPAISNGTPSSARIDILSTPFWEFLLRLFIGEEAKANDVFLLPFGSFGHLTIPRWYYSDIVSLSTPFWEFQIDYVIEYIKSQIESFLLPFGSFI